MEFIKFKNLYIPLDQSKNCLRHVGFKVDKQLYLELHEFLYVIGLEREKIDHIFLKAYFYIKNNDMNLLRAQKEYSTEEEDLYLWIKEITDFSDVPDAYSTFNSNIKIYIFEEEYNKNRNNTSYEKIKKLDVFIKRHELLYLETKLKNVSLEKIEKKTKLNITNFYKFLKNLSSGYPNFYLYLKTSEFHRFKNKPIKKILFIDPHIQLQEVFVHHSSCILCLLSYKEFVFLDTSTYNPTLEIDNKLKKYNF